MKKLLTMAAVLTVAASMAYAASNEVYSVNVVGFNKTEIPSDLCIMAMPFDSESGTIDEVVGTNGVYGATVASADNVMIYDASSQTFETYWLFYHSSIGGAKWRNSSGWATNVYLYPGMSFWHRSRAAEASTNVMVGDVVADTIVTNIIVEGLQLLSYPYSCDITLTDMNLTNGVSGATVASADNIMIYDASSQTFETYWLFYHSSIGGSKWRNSSGWATNVVIKMGQGFWYRSRNSSNLFWEEPTPYNLNQ